MKTLTAEEVLERFREALDSPDLSHVTAGHPVSPNFFHVYHRDPASPTGVRFVCSAPRADARARELVQGKYLTLGGRSGNR